ncbi:MAG: DapH/DapD/GlmU-related protein [Lentimonas sp.]
MSIGDDCFIGGRAMILKRLTVGARSIVGAGAVVVNDVPADVIVAGNPARIVNQLTGSQN